MKGESFVIANAERPLVRVMALEAPESAHARRLGFMRGQFSVPDDFDRMGEHNMVEVLAGSPL